MALITIRDDEGRPHLVHTSVFDRMERAVSVFLPEEAKSGPKGEWSEVWGRFSATPPASPVEMPAAYRTSGCHTSDTAG